MITAPPQTAQKTIRRRASTSFNVSGHRLVFCFAEAIASDNQPQVILCLFINGKSKQTMIL